MTFSEYRFPLSSRGNANFALSKKELIESFRAVASLLGYCYSEGIPPEFMRQLLNQYFAALQCQWHLSHRSRNLRKPSSSFLVTDSWPQFNLFRSFFSQLRSTMSTRHSPSRIVSALLGLHSIIGRQPNRILLTVRRYVSQDQCHTLLFPNRGSLCFASPRSRCLLDELVANAY